MSGLIREHTLVYRVDTIQATPGFAAIKAGLDMIERDAGQARAQVDLLDAALINMGFRQRRRK